MLTLSFKKTLNFLFWWFKKENLVCQKYICIFSLLLLATTVLHCITLVTTVLHCITLFTTVLHCSPLRITDDYCIALLTTVFHWITLLNSKDHWWPVRIFVDYFITLLVSISVSGGVLHHHLMAVICIVTVTSLLEAFTAQIDNHVLPLFMYNLLLTLKS